MQVGRSRAAPSDICCRSAALPSRLLRQAGVELLDECFFVFAGIGAGEETSEAFLIEPFPRRLFVAGINRKEQRAIRLGGFEIAGRVADHQYFFRCLFADRGELDVLEVNGGNRPNQTIVLVSLVPGCGPSQSQVLG